MDEVAGSVVACFLQCIRVEKRFFLRNMIIKLYIFSFCVCNKFYIPHLRSLQAVLFYILPSQFLPILDTNSLSLLTCH
jgi:hypothetical protein